MPTVKNPPALVAQETGAWCFAAAEQMVRSFFGFAARTQYQIARQLAASRGLVDPNFIEQWQLALALDESANQPDNNGANNASQVVQLVRATYGTINDADTHGRFVENLSAADIRGEIDANRIFVIGNAIHFYVVYGYEDNGNTMLVRDPWPPNHGGQNSRVTLATYQDWDNRIAIFFAP